MIKIIIVKCLNNQQSQNGTHRKSSTIGNRIISIRNQRFGRPMCFNEANQEGSQRGYQDPQQRYHWTHCHRCWCQSTWNRIALTNLVRIEGIFLSKIKNVAYVFVPSKKALGTACGTTRNVIAVSILKNKLSKVNDEIQRVVGECERLFISSWIKSTFCLLICFESIFLIIQSNTFCHTNFKKKEK